MRSRFFSVRASVRRRSPTARAYRNTRCARALCGRLGQARSLLRLAPQVLALRAGDDRAEPAHRDARARAGEALPRLWGRAVEVFDTTFAEVMLELGVGIEMCAPRSGEPEGRGRASREVGQAHLLQAQEVRRRGRPRGAARRVGPQGRLRHPNRATGELPETLEGRAVAAEIRVRLTLVLDQGDLLGAARWSPTRGEVYSGACLVGGSRPSAAAGCPSAPIAVPRLVPHDVLDDRSAPP